MTSSVKADTVVFFLADVLHHFTHSDFLVRFTFIRCELLNILRQRVHTFLGLGSLDHIIRYLLIVRNLLGRCLLHHHLLLLHQSSLWLCNWLILSSRLLQARLLWATFDHELLLEHP